MRPFPYDERDIEQEEKSVTDENFDGVDYLQQFPRNMGFEELAVSNEDSSPHNKNKPSLNQETPNVLYEEEEPYCEEDEFAEPEPSYEEEPDSEDSESETINEPSYEEEEPDFQNEEDIDTIRQPSSKEEVSDQDNEESNDDILPDSPHEDSPEVTTNLGAVSSLNPDIPCEYSNLPYICPFQKTCPEYNKINKRS